MPASPSLRAFLKRNHWPQILNLQEVKINPSDEVTKSAVQNAVNRRASDIEDEGPEYTVRFCLPRDKYNAKGFGRKVYGVATVMRKDYFEQDVTICREVDWDLEGRVLVVETKSKLAVLNLYCVNGTDNDYKDSATGQVVGTRHDRKLAFHKLLLKECKDLETQGFRVVVTGDLNISPRPIDGFPKLRTVPEQHVQNRADYNHKFLDEKNMDGLRAIDSFRHLHPTTRKYSWLSTTRPWLSSCDRVDHILLSRSMVDDHDMISHADGSHATSGEGIQSSSDDTEPKVILLEADILMTEADRSPSDHCPIFVTLDVD
jgi:exonuclease III